MFFDDIIFNVKPENNQKLFDEHEGFLKGNMFRNEYVPYKNYSVAKLEGKSEKDQLLLKIYQYDFALNDLSLYLDIHPDDMRIYEEFRKYTDEQKACIDIYEKNYGPLELEDSNYSTYMWENGPWPFVGGGI